MQLRSMLFAPSDSPRKLAGLAASGADAVVADLEDAVAASQKSVARETAAHFASNLPEGCPPLWSRICSVDVDEAEADLEALDLPTIVGLVVPKVESLQAIEKLCSRLAKSRHLQRAVLVPQIETARGLLAAEQASRWPDAVVTLSFGSVDFARDLRIEFDPGHPLIENARHRLLVAAVGRRLAAPLDGPWMKVRDLEGLAEDANHARALGFGGKTAIHPAQIVGINDAFSSLDPVRRAHLERVIEAYESNPDSAALVVDNIFVDEPVYRAALDALERAQTTNV